MPLDTPDTRDTPETPAIPDTPVAPGVAYDVAESWLGRMLVARTEGGVCVVSFGEDDAALEADLRATVAHAERRPDDERLRAWTDALLAHLDGRLPSPNVPLDVRGTLFQRRVWWALRAIPYGATRSYGEIARGLGTPARAVARACAGNPAALVIPCHRAVGQGGDLTGFRWGLWRKRLLLERERQVCGEPLQLGLL